MKPNHADSHSPLCRLVRLVRALGWTGGKLVQRHLACCASCRSHLAEVDELERQLRLGARERSAAAPVALEQRILQAVKADSSISRPALPRALGWSLGGALGAAALLAVLFGLAGRRATERPEARPALAASSQVDVVELAAAVEQFPDRIWSRLGPSASQLARRNPLRSEMESVVSDARSALDFLALNFLPSTSSPAGAEEPTDYETQRG